MVSYHRILQTSLMPSANEALAIALRAAVGHLEGLDSRPIAAPVDAATLRDRLGKPLGVRGTPAGQVVTDLIEAVQGGILGSASGRFFGWVIGGALPSAIAADWLTSAWDQNAVLYASGPAAAIVEEITGEWLKEILGIPQNASFAIVTGCQTAHVVCLAAARHALLARRGWDVEQRGLYNAPPIRILSGDQRHGSIERAVRLLGLGTESIHAVNLHDLEATLAAEPSEPTIVLLQAGDINTGAFDSFETLIPIARRHGAWVHVDGAFGMWAAASPKLRHLLRGVELADSWATDGHKWLNVPFDSGYAFVADVDAHRAAVSHRAPYLTHAADARDPFDWNPEWSRRARGFTTYAALRELGRDGIADLVERCCAHAHALVMGITRLPGAELLWEPVINQGLVRFFDPRPGAFEKDHDRRTDQVVAEIVASGEAFFSATIWRGRRAMRVSVCNWRTSEKDVERAVEAARKALGCGETNRSVSC
jgi:glutamate/tyrosine decarboxylase-like PLP-dependent enzyme